MRVNSKCNPSANCATSLEPNFDPDTTPALSVALVGGITGGVMAVLLIVILVMTVTIILLAVHIRKSGNKNIATATTGKVTFGFCYDKMLCKLYKVSFVRETHGIKSLRVYSCVGVDYSYSSVRISYTNQQKCTNKCVDGSTHYGI